MTPAPDLTFGVLDVLDAICKHMGAALWSSSACLLGFSNRTSQLKDLLSPPNASKLIAPRGLEQPPWQACVSQQQITYILNFCKGYKCFHLCTQYFREPFVHLDNTYALASLRGLMHAVVYVLCWTT